jgi:hypothetical protein
MSYYAAQLPDGRWGIFENDRMLATIGSQAECRELMKLLNHRKNASGGKSEMAATVILPSRLIQNSTNRSSSKTLRF